MSGKRGWGTEGLGRLLDAATRKVVLDEAAKAVTQRYAAE